MNNGDGRLLMMWLQLLGWVVVAEETDDGWIAIARHEDLSGRVLEVNVSATSHGELTWRLFSRALAAIERERTLLAA